MAAVADFAKPIGLPRKAPRDERRVQLIEATIRVLAEKGYARTTMGDVARSAGLSNGLVNFHFDSKENLLLETLLYLTDEYRQHWQAALVTAGQSAAQQICALIKANFDPALFTVARISAWCSFWGEAQTRPIYQDHCGKSDLTYNAALEGLCARMMDEHGYGGKPVLVARAIRLTIEGAWLDQMTMKNPYGRDAALATAMTAATAFFPRHFCEVGLMAGQ